MEVKTYESALGAFFDRVNETPDKLAIIDGRDRHVTYRELASRAEIMAAQLAKDGDWAGKRILLAGAVDIELYVAMAALWHLGAVIVFPEPALGLKGLKHAVAIAKPDAYLGLGWYRFLPLISSALRKTRHKFRLNSKQFRQDLPAYPSQSQDAALISFTTGSTGLPKAIMRSHGFLRAQIKALAPILSDSQNDSVDLVAFPVFVIAELALGKSCILPNWRLSRHDRLSTQRLEHRIKSHKISRLLIPPSICEKLVNVKNELRLDAILTGGGPVFLDLLDRLKRKYPETEIISVYGSTEAEPIATQRFSQLTDQQIQKMRNGFGLYAGAPVEGIQVDILDDEIIVTGAHVNKSYLNAEHNEANKLTIDGEIWHRTGDAGARDDSGDLWLKGRLDAKAGSLFPFEIELRARNLEGVRAAAMLPSSNPPVLAIEGDGRHRDKWQTAFSDIKGLKIVILKKIPFDRRHRSKVDNTALRKRIGKLSR